MFVNAPICMVGSVIEPQRFRDVMASFPSGVVVLTAFGEHGQYFHGFELWENLVRVPLFFVVPGAPHNSVA